MAEPTVLNAARDATALENHFAFGENWADFAQLVDERRLQSAIDGLRKLLAGRELTGKRFLDIGCGSGLHSLAALRLGASEVVALDLDPRSVETTRALIGKYAPGARMRADTVSVFELDPQTFGTFDVVYSWGVLHHTGDMFTAVRKAAAMVSQGGSFLFALYRRTWMCPFWGVEKRWYSRASKRAQKLASNIYLALFTLRLWAGGRTVKSFDASVAQDGRGMSLRHDIHDWLGGYPYESISCEGVDSLMRELGFAHHKSFVRREFTARTGLFSSGCDEYHYIKS